ncbi:hypothetical protein Tco_1175190 [Tanacetum coccineum]
MASLALHGDGALYCRLQLGKTLLGVGDHADGQRRTAVTPHQLEKVIRLALSALVGLLAKVNPAYITTWGKSLVTAPAVQYETDMTHPLDLPGAVITGGPLAFQPRVNSPALAFSPCDIGKPLKESTLVASSLVGPQSHLVHCAECVGSKQQYTQLCCRTPPYYTTRGVTLNPSAMTPDIECEVPLGGNQRIIYPKNILPPTLSHLIFRIARKRPASLESDTHSFDQECDRRRGTNGPCAIGEYEDDKIQTLHINNERGTRRVGKFKEPCVFPKPSHWKSAIHAHAAGTTGCSADLEFNTQM